MSFDGIIMVLVGITVAVVLVGNLVLPAIYNTNTSTWGAPVVIFFTTLLPIIAVATLLLILLH